MTRLLVTRLNQPLKKGTNLCCFRDRLINCLNECGAFTALFNKGDYCAKPDELYQDKPLVNVVFDGAAKIKKIKKPDPDGPKIGGQLMVGYQKSLNVELSIYSRRCDSTFCQAAEIAEWISCNMRKEKLCVLGVEWEGESYATSTSGEQDLSIFNIRYSVTFNDYPNKNDLMGTPE